MILETTTGTCVGSDHGGARIVLPFLFVRIAIFDFCFFFLNFFLSQTHPQHQIKHTHNTKWNTPPTSQCSFSFDGEKAKVSGHAPRRSGSHHVLHFLEHRQLPLSSLHPRHEPIETLLLGQWTTRSRDPSSPTPTFHVFSLIFEFFCHD